MSEKWYFDTKTHAVSQGKSDAWGTRMGPYDTREEAESALEIAKARTAAADRFDEED